jgi:hypothetical protein
VVGGEKRARQSLVLVRGSIRKGRISGAPGELGRLRVLAQNRLSIGAHADSLARTILGNRTSALAAAASLSRR